MFTQKNILSPLLRPARGEKRYVNLIFFGQMRYGGVKAVVSHLCNHSAGAEATRPWSLISRLIFHFIAHLSISNGANGSICMTGFVTGRIRCQTRLNITPERYHNQASNERGPARGKTDQSLPLVAFRGAGGGAWGKKEVALCESDERPGSVARPRPGIAPAAAGHRHTRNKKDLRITGDTENR